MATALDGLSFPLANTSYERPAVWPPPMHKCARDPALPCGPRGRPLCTIVQRWDPALPRAPTVSSPGHAWAATGAHAVRHTCGRWASMERVAGQLVSHCAQRPDERLPREKGRPAPFLLAGVQGQSPAGVQGQSPAGGAGGKAPAGAQGQSPARYHPATPDADPPPENTPYAFSSPLPAGPAAGDATSITFTPTSNSCSADTPVGASVI
jgi:hypothetical protein